MKLLSKQEINAHKAVEKKQQIDEGMKLARKVDNLRALALAEDEALRKHRDETLSAITKEIEDLLSRKSTLSSEVSALEARREEALKPLDAEQEELEKIRVEVVAEKEALALAKNTLKAEKEKIAADAAQVEKDRVFAENLTEAAWEAAKEVKRDIATADTYLAEATKTKENAEERAKEARIELAERETALLGRERDIAAKEVKIAAQQKKLNEKEREIADRYATLLRSEKRIYGT